MLPALFRFCDLLISSCLFCFLCSTRRARHARANSRAFSPNLSAAQPFVSSLGVVPGVELLENVLPKVAVAATV